MNVSFRRHTIAETSELRRIRNMPRRSWTDAQLQTLAKEMTAALRTPNGTMELRPVQALALHDIGTAGGLFGPIRVGGGKTLVSLLAPYVLESRAPMLILPASLVQKTHREMQELSRHWRIPRTIRIISYEMLGRVQAANTFVGYPPDLIVADEAHRLKNKKAGVTRRVVRYMRENPGTKFVAISGTIMSRSLRDFSHIIRWCLPKGAPVPHSEGEVEEWADALDVFTNPLKRSSPGALLSFCKPEDEGEDDVQTARRGFQRRLLDTEGVVATNGESVSCSLYISALKYEPSAATEVNFQTLRSRWETPDGWALSEAVAVWRQARELALGLHYVWWNDNGYSECLQKTLSANGLSISPIERRILSDSARMTGSGLNVAKALARLNGNGIAFSPVDTVSIRSNTIGSMLSSGASATSASSAGTGRNASTLTTTIEQGGLEAFFAAPATEPSAPWEMILRAFPGLSSIFAEAVQAARAPEAWLNARRAWSSFVRETLRYSRTLDTELQVANACRSGALDRQELDAWTALRPSFTPASKAQWHDDTALQVCQRWLAEKKGIVWCEHTFFAEELARRSGLPYYGAGGLTRRGESIMDASGPIIASIAANSTGRNLQAWNTNLITSCPSTATILEQLIGRTHRDGQTADEVEVDIMLGCWEHWDGFEKARAAARMAQDMLGQPQKILIGDVEWPAEIEVAQLPGARWHKTVDLKVEVPISE